MSNILSLWVMLQELEEKEDDQFNYIKDIHLL